MHSHYCRPNPPKGFTLLEIMLVVMIVGMLAAIVGPRIGTQREAVGIRSTHNQIDSLATSLGTYQLDIGIYPSTQQGLEALVVGPAEIAPEIWNGPYVRGNLLPVDSWQRPFKYACPSRHERMEFDLWSLGRDGVAGTADDIVNW